MEECYMSCCGNHHHESHQSGNHRHGTQDHQNESNALKEQNEQLRKELQKLKNEKG